MSRGRLFTTEARRHGGRQNQTGGHRGGGGHGGVKPPGYRRLSGMKDQISKTSAFAKWPFWLEFPAAPLHRRSVHRARPANTLPLYAGAYVRFLRRPRTILNSVTSASSVASGFDSGFSLCLRASVVNYTLSKLSAKPHSSSIHWRSRWKPAVRAMPAIWSARNLWHTSVRIVSPAPNSAHSPALAMRTV